jgi:hypothetical protein
MLGKPSQNWVQALTNLEKTVKYVITAKNKRSFWCDSKSVWLCFCCGVLRRQIKYNKHFNPLIVYTKKGAFLVGKKHE